MLKVIRRIKEVDIEKEIIIVDDGSSDGTREILSTIDDRSIKIVKHSYNQGKGAAIRSALPYISAGMADVVYGSRFLAKRRTDSVFHYFVNRFLTFLVNFLFGSHLTDIGTCYKVFKTPVIQGLGLESNGFEIEPELTIKILKKGYEILEIPISYQSRSHGEGKKITWRDGIKTVLVILKYRFRHF